MPTADAALQPLRAPTAAEIKLEIKGVDVTPLVALVRTLTWPPLWTLEVDARSRGDRRTLASFSYASGRLWMHNMKEVICTGEN